jgi:hypothetical protein
MALTVTVMGSLIALALITMGYSFLKSSARQRNFYGDHVSVTDYVQDVKGKLIAKNISDGQVQHGKGLSSSSSPIASIDNLVLDGYNSPDIPVGSWGLGKQKVSVTVYDAYYFYDQLDPALRNDSAQMALFPPPINALAAGSTGADAETEGESQGDSTIGTNSSPGTFYPWSSFGAYVVRVQLYNVDMLGATRLTRTAEEAFFQVLNPAP